MRQADFPTLAVQASPSWAASDTPMTEEENGESVPTPPEDREYDPLCEFPSDADTPTEPSPSSSDSQK